MTRDRSAFIVAHWEFRRYFKWKDQLLGLVFFMVLGAVWAGAAAVATAKRGTVTIALEGVELVSAPDGPLRFVRAASDTQARREALQSGAVRGVLSRQPDGSFNLLVAKEPSFQSDLLTVLGEAVVAERLAASGMTREALARVLAPPVVDVRFIDSARAQRTGAEKVAAALFIVVLLLAVFTGMAYVFAGITGEKQLRVTESIVATISPQAWIDGKVLGISAYALAATVNMILGSLLVALVAHLTSGFAIPAAAVRPVVVLVLVIYVLLGLLLWNSFFAAVAATISDPNTSAKSSLLFLPVVPVVCSLAVLRDPDGLAARALSLFPLTSAPALPIRFVLSDPGPLDIVASLALLVGAIWLVRRVAGRIFEIGILMYGKEPTVREIVRWATHRRVA